MNLRSSWQYISETSKRRLATNKTSRHMGGYGTGIEVIGVAGEVVARRYLGLDEGVHLGFDGGTDIVYYGLRIDVKATILTPTAQYKFLQWAERKPVRSDIILFTLIDPINRAGYPAGYATRDEILAAPINPLRHIPCHEISIRDLHPEWELFVFGKKASEDLKLGVVKTFSVGQYWDRSELEVT